MIYQVCAGAATFAFIILVVYLVSALRTLNGTLKQTTESLEEAKKSLETIQTTVDELRPQVEAILSEATKALQETNEIVTQVKQKTNETTAVFDRIRSIGDTVDRVAHNIVYSAEKNSDRLGNVVAAVSTGLELVRKWKRK